MEKLTRFERTRVVSARALQLALGAPPLLKVSHKRSMGEVAADEFEQKVIPLAVLRKYPNGEVRKIEIN